MLPPIRTPLLCAAIGAGVGRADRATTAAIFITLKPWDERVGGPRSRSSRGCGRSSQAVSAAASLHAGGQDIRVGGRLTQDRYQYTLQDADLDELNRWAPKVLAQAADAADAARRHHRPADRRHHRDPDHRPRPAARFGIQPQVIDDTLYDAFGQRRSRSISPR